MEPFFLIMLGLTLGMVLCLSVLLAWSIVGLVVVAFAYYTQPRRRTSTGACGTCSDLQALWESMNWFDKIAAFPNYVVAKLICDSRGCPVTLDY